MEPSERETRLGALENGTVDLEARLLEQEHRPLALLRNFFGRKAYADGDPRRRAVLVALVWRFVAPATIATVAVTGSGLLAWLTYVAFLDQNALIREQIEQSKTQLQAIRDQAGEQREQDLLRRRRELIEILWPRDEGLVGLIQGGVPLALKDVAVLEYVDLLEELGMEIDLQEARLEGVTAFAEKDLSEAKLARVDLRGANLYGTVFLDTDLPRADLRKANLHGADLRGATLSLARLDGAKLFRTDLRGAELEEAILAGVETMFGARWEGAKLNGADLRGANLTGVGGSPTWLPEDPPRIDEETSPPSRLESGALPPWWQDLVAAQAQGSWNSRPEGRADDH